MTPGERPLLLIADPEPYSRRIAEMTLGSTYAIIQTETIADTVRRASNDRPSAIVAELFLEDGAFEKLRADLQEEPITRGIPLILLTNLASWAVRRYPELDPEQVVDKHEMPRSLLEALRDRTTRFQTVEEATTISVLLEKGREILMQVYGSDRRILRGTSPPWDQFLECDGLLRDRRGAGFGPALEECGTRLFRLLEQCCGLNSLRLELMRRHPDMPLRLQFIGTDELLQIPFETMMDPAERKPLALQHRLTRAILRPPGVSAEAHSDFLARRVKTGRAFHALLIGLAEDPQSDLYRVKQELLDAHNIVAGFHKGIRVDCLVLFPAQATRDRIGAAIAGQHWDMIHFAGHCPPPRSDPHVNGIRFHSSGESAGPPQTLTAPDLEDFLYTAGEKLPSFLIVNCCHGTEIYSEVLANSGVPAFLTFRGSHSSGDFVVFTNALYEGLTEFGDLEMAVQLARSRVYERLSSSNVWAAVSLALQSL